MSQFNYVVVVNLLPQDATRSELLFVAAYFAWPLKQTIMQSADDAKRMVQGGLYGSRVIVWSPERWRGGDIIQWLGVPCEVQTLHAGVKDFYYMAVKGYSGVIPPAAPEQP